MGTNNYEWLDLIPGGWRNLAYNMIEEIMKIYPEYNITDLKEKFGSLRCYDAGVPNILRGSIDTIIDKYERLSAQTCVRCGQPATKYSMGYILPWCDKCGIDEEKYYKRFNLGR